MPNLGEWRRRIWYLLNRKRFERELREEMRAHRAALEDPSRFGNSLRLHEEAGDVWGWRALELFAKDLRFSFRMVFRMPLLAGVVILSLGIGIGANTTVFSWMESFLLNPIPGVEQSVAYLLVEPVYPSGNTTSGVSFPEYRDMREALVSFEDLAAFRMVEANLTDSGASRRIFALAVSSNYFATLGLVPERGHLDPGISESNGPPGVVISSRLWQDRLGGDPDILGRALEVNGQVVPVAGVAPRAFHGTITGLSFDLWIPDSLIGRLFPASDELEDRAQRAYTVTGRLRDGVTRAAAQDEVATLMSRLASDFPATNDGLQARILSFWEAPRGGGQFVLPGLAILQAVMVVLLLAVCGNTANLLLGRSISREREIGIRMASGAGKWQIVRLLMAESLILGGAGAMLGTVIALATTGIVSSLRFSTLLPVRFEPALDLYGVAFSAGLGLAAALIFGVVPAVHLARDANLAVRTRSRKGPRTTRLVLVGAEAALAVSVLIAGGIFLEDFRQTLDRDPGFRPGGILLAAYDVSGSDLGQSLVGERADPSLLGTFTVGLMEELSALPGVEATAIASFVPLDIHGLPSTRFRLDGRAPEEPNGNTALTNVVTSGYFEAMAIPIVEGRDFRPVGEPGLPEVIVNEAFVRRFAPNDPVGRVLESFDQRYRIVGVVGDAVYRSFSEPPTPFVYYSFGDQIRGRGQIHLRTRPGDEGVLLPQVRRVVEGLDPTLPLFDIRTMVEHVDTNLVLRRVPAQMFALLGPLLLALAAVGVYSVVAYLVSDRSGEIAVRLALGAPATGLARGIVMECLHGVAIGVAIGWSAAVVVYDHLGGGPYEPVVFLGIPLTLGAVAAVAAWIPARRATRLDLARALRDD